MPPPENRMPRYKVNNTVSMPQRPQEEPSSQELIRMCANQCLKEQYEGQQSTIHKKVNSNVFQSVKFQENKKRVRPIIPVDEEERDEEQILYEQPSEMQIDCEMSMPVS